MKVDTTPTIDNLRKAEKAILDIMNNPHCDEQMHLSLCLRLAKTKELLLQKIKQCKHHPFDRDINENEEQYCTICGTVTKSAVELYPDDDDFSDMGKPFVLPPTV